MKIKNQTSIKTHYFIISLFLLTNPAYGNSFSFTEDTLKETAILHLTKIAEDSKIPAQEKWETFKSFNKRYTEYQDPDIKKAREEFIKLFAKDTTLNSEYKYFIASIYNSWGASFEKEKIAILDSIFKDSNKNLDRDCVKDEGDFFRFYGQTHSQNHKN